MGKGPDMFSMKFFGEDNSSASDRGDEKTVDSSGNEYDAQGNLLREKPSAHLEKALNLVRKENPGMDIPPSDPKVQFYLRQFRQEEQQNDKKTNAKKNRVQ